MIVQPLKAAIHKYDLALSKEFLTKNEIQINGWFCDYLIRQIEINSKKNKIRLGNFKSSINVSNPLYSFYRAIASQHGDFIETTHKIMSTLIIAKTPKNSSSGNYLFILYNYANDNECYLDSSGEEHTTKIDEKRLAIIKYELTEIPIVEYEHDKNGNLFSKVVLSDDTLPKQNAKTKKAVFINGASRSIIQYEVAIVDYESPDVAKFFTQDIVGCDIITKPANYIKKLGVAIQDFVALNYPNNDELVVEITQKFRTIIKNETYIDQSILGSDLFKNIEKEEALEEVNERLLDYFTQKGLGFNDITVDSEDRKNYFKSFIIKFGTESSIKYSDEDYVRGIIDWDPEPDHETNKYKITILTDKNPDLLKR